MERDREKFLLFRIDKLCFYFGWTLHNPIYSSKYLQGFLFLFSSFIIISFYFLLLVHKTKNTQKYIILKYSTFIWCILIYYKLCVVQKTKTFKHYFILSCCCCLYIMGFVSFSRKEEENEEMNIFAYIYIFFFYETFIFLW